MRPGREAAFAALCGRYGVPTTALGATGGDSLEVTGCFTLPLADLAAARGVLPSLFG